MTAIDAVRAELIRHQIEMLSCYTDEGYVITGKRYAFQYHMQKVEEFRKSLKWMEENMCIKNK